MARFKIVSGDEISEELYLKTWKLDNRTFSRKDRLTKEKALEWFF